jgi:hypothetical protein
LFSLHLFSIFILFLFLFLVVTPSEYEFVWFFIIEAK